MGWTLTVLGVALVIVVVAGAALALCRRYCVGWQWGTRNIWNVCEEWRQRLSWLWAPREEKVGLVKAQHPTAQTIPGLCRQRGNASQYMLHSNSDLKLNSQGDFTRFEPVDRDLHSPLGTTLSSIPPQPLRPAPQPRPTARARPSPLQPSSTLDYLRMQEAGPGPLTPPPSLQTVYASPFRFDDDPANVAQSHGDPRLMYELEDERRKEIRCNPYRPYDAGVESTRIRYGVHGAPIATLDGKGDEDGGISYGSYDIVQRGQMIRQHARNDSRGSPSSFGMANSSNAASQTVLRSIYGAEPLSKMLQSTQSLGNELDYKSDEVQCIEMTSFRSSSVQDDIDSSYMFREPQDLQKVSHYIRSLPELPIYDSMNELGMHQEQDHAWCDDTIHGSIDAMKVNGHSASSPVPPPPAPPDPPNDVPKKNEPTTGERIFNALRLVTSQSYIDASEFYKSVVFSAQQVQRFTFPPRSPSLAEVNADDQMESDARDSYAENDPDIIGPDDSRRSSDLYSPELNLEAHRTAREVYNSLQDPPSSPLLIKHHNPLTCMSDPSVTRTSQDILISIEQGRKNMQRLNGIHEFNELDDTDSLRTRSNDDFYAALKENAFITSFSLKDYNDISPGCRRGPQGPEPEPPPDESDDLEEVFIAGHICVGVEYVGCITRGNDNERCLVVSVLEARDLITSDGQPARHTFARVCLLPEREKVEQTRLYKGSSSPSYQEKFLFHLDSGPTVRTLLVEVYSNDTIIGGGESLIGEATLRLDSAPKVPATTWLSLLTSIPRLGELIFSLSYLLTAERITLVVVKAKNLRGRGSVPGDYFVEVYLLQQGKELQKEKTSVRRRENSPIFNESMIFNVPVHMLQDIQLRLTVMEINSEQGVNSKPYPVGHIVVGSTATGTALTHWRLMLECRKYPVAMWHQLRKRST